MNSNKLLGKIRSNGDTQADLAAALGISKASLNLKIHGKNGIDWRQREIAGIRKRYRLTPEEIDEIFFGDDLSSQDKSLCRN